MPGTVTGWNQKATLDEQKASAAVGGFSKDGATDYHTGLRVLNSRHISAGSKTISDVVEIGKRSMRTGFVSHPPHKALEPQGSAAGGWVIFALIVCGVGWLIRRAFLSSSKPRVAVEISSQDISDDAHTRELLPIVPTGAIPRPDEHFYLETRNVDIIGEHHHARFVGGSAGLSVRVARGVYLRSGSSRGRRVDSVTSEVDDRGTLYISNKRVLYIGARKTVEVPFSKIVGFDPYMDAVKVNRSNAAAILLRTGTTEAAIILDRAMRGDVTSEAQKHADLLGIIPRADAALAAAKERHEAGTMTDEEYAKMVEQFTGIKDNTQKLIAKVIPSQST